MYLFSLWATTCNKIIVIVIDMESFGLFREECSAEKQTEKQYQEGQPANSGLPRKNGGRCKIHKFTKSEVVRHLKVYQRCRSRWYVIVQFNVPLDIV